MQKLEKLLKEKNITQTELSKRTGIMRPQINRYIKGVHGARTYNLIKIANALNCKVDEIVGDRDA